MNAPPAKKKTKSKLASVSKKAITKACPMPTSKAIGSAIGKALNFPAEEDNMFTKTVVNILTKPIHRSGMKSNDFGTMCIRHEPRNTCSKCIRLENQSGLNNVACITKETEALYKAATKKPFCFAADEEVSTNGEVGIDEDSD
jgi:hypothetical protein